MAHVVTMHRMSTYVWCQHAKGHSLNTWTVSHVLYKWDTSHANESRHIKMRPVTHGQLRVLVMKKTKLTRRQDSDVFHTGMIHVIYEWVVSHMGSCAWCLPWKRRSWRDIWSYAPLLTVVVLTDWQSAPSAGGSHIHIYLINIYIYMYTYKYVYI